MAVRVTTLEQEQEGITQAELLYRLRWFTLVRWLMAAMAMALLLVSWGILGVRFRTDGQVTIAPALAVVAAVFAYNLLFTMLLRGRQNPSGKPLAKAPSERWIASVGLAQIVCDLLAVGALVRHSGGIENPFLLLVLLPTVIATQLLSAKLSYILAIAAAAMVNALAWGQWASSQKGVSDGIIWPGEVLPHSLGFYQVLAISAAISVSLVLTAVIAASIARRLRQREGQLEDAYRQLRQTDDAKSFFMRKAGHEMRAPLAAIYSILETLEASGLTLPEATSRLLSRARHRLGGLVSLVDDLRRYARLRSGGELLRRSEVNLGEVVSSTAELFRQQAADSNVTLNCRSPSLVVQADEEMMRELITNLLANAIQYTPQGGRIDVTLSQENGAAVLNVSDTGIGLSEEARLRLFDEFYRAIEAKAVFPGGTGLGLAICRRIVQMHGGQIEAANAPGGGAAFTVRLPEHFS